MVLNQFSEVKQRFPNFKQIVKTQFTTFRVNKAAFLMLMFLIRSRLNAAMTLMMEHLENVP